MSISMSGNPQWLHRMAAAEEEGLVSVGGWIHSVPPALEAEGLGAPPADEIPERVWVVDLLVQGFLYQSVFAVLALFDREVLTPVDGHHEAAIICDPAECSFRSEHLVIPAANVERFQARLTDFGRREEIRLVECHPLSLPRTDTAVAA